MTILLLDNLQSRRQAIKDDLLRAGWLVSEWLNGDAETLHGLLSESSIVIILEESFIHEMNKMSNKDFSQMAFIGYAPLGVESKKHEAISADLMQEEKLDTLVQLITRKTTAWCFKTGFPLSTNKSMNTLMNKALKAARSHVPVLILGETGVGKEMIAQYVHFNSKQANGPFVAVNCAAIPESMIEAVLFGYEKGSFTNAINQHIGKFERAHHGTLFLDEIGEMSLELQSKLLRVLQNNEIERLGGKEVIKVDIRVIAATNKNLGVQIEKGLFRADLYYRINVINLYCMSLRERTEDISVLANYFMNLYAAQMDKVVTMSHDAEVKLKLHEWPGNVRELQNVMQRSVILTESNVIEASDITFDTVQANAGNDERDSLKSKEAETIVNTLKETNGCRSAAAKRLMISPRTLRYKISKLKDVGYLVPRSEK